MIKKTIIILSFLLITSIATATGPPDYEDYPPWYYYVYPEFPETGCDDAIDSDVFTNISPSVSEDDVIITAKGVQICSNITPPQGCTINVTYQWLNYTQYLSDWLDWADAQYWGEWDDIEEWGAEIDWTNRTDVYNDSYWYNFSSTYTGINTTTQICSYNDNVSCHIEDDWESMYSDWRINWEMNCSGMITSGECYYYFEPEDCPNINYISPPSPNGTVCPCCAEICAGVMNDDGHPMNIRFFLKEQNETIDKYNNVATFESVYNGTYCFCCDGYDIHPHAVGHTKEEIIPSAINTWYNISFQSFDSVGIEGTPSEVIIPYDGHYTLNMFAMCIDSNANPAGDKIAFRFTRNGAVINSSYHELDFQKQDNLREVVSFAHTVLNKGDKINFQYIVNNVNIHLYEDATWSSNNTSVYASIERTDNYHIPMKYNTTYHWYVNITDTVTNESIETDIFTFRTYPNPSYCPCGPEEVEDFVISSYEDTDNIKDDSWLIGPIILFSIFGFIAYHRTSKKKKKEK